jgi:hypothetical protein
MPAKTPPRCPTCSAFRAFPEPLAVLRYVGTCRAHAPTPRVLHEEADGPDGWRAAWPAVTPDDGCEEHEPAGFPSPVAGLEEAAEALLAAVMDGSAVPWGRSGKRAMPPRPDPAWQLAATYHPGEGGPSVEVWRKGSEWWAVADVSGRMLGCPLDDGGPDDAAEEA